MKLYYIFVALIMIFLTTACVPESKKVLTEVDLRISDPVFQSISNHQYAENTDSLLFYTNHEDPTYRYLAARAFASHQDPRALDSLYALLDDPSLKVRSTAAYAIGQIREESAIEKLLKGFRQRDTISIDNASNGEILASVGKLGDMKYADYMISADGYRDADTLLLLGRMKGLYQFALRGIHKPEITQLVVETVRDYKLDDRIRLMAAHYLARPENLDIEKVKFQIAEAFIDEQNPNIKMALVSALRHTNDKEIEATLIDQLNLELDYRVKCNLIRTLSGYDYITSAEKILLLLKDPNPHIAISAAQFLGENGSKDDAAIYRRIANDSIDWRVKAEIYRSIFKILPYYYSKTLNATRWQMQNLIKAETDTFKIANYLKVLGGDPGSYEYLMSFVKDIDNIRINTAVCESLSSILSSENFAGTYQGYARFHRRKIFEFLQAKMKSGDEGIIGLVADAIAKDESQLVPLIDSTNFLFEARELLKVPGQIESVHAVEKAIAKVRGVNRPNFTEYDSSNPVDWSFLEDLSANNKVIVKTNKGNFKFDLMVEASPGSALNFLKLALADFYDDKIFHRVVPNFVIQTGSPRGDNYGGKDYVIRSDLGPSYYDGEGYIGMASAGPDTESTQWFVTHSPTPHLDGKYSIFGKVVEGMDVVHSIQIGDVIQDVILTNN